MTKNILLLFFISHLSMFGQSISFEKIVKTDSSDTKEILFDRLNSRLIEHFGGQKKYQESIIQSDKEIGVIKFKYSSVYDPKGNRSDDGFIKYNVNIFFKNGRFKITLTNLIHSGKGISLNKITDSEEYPHDESNFLKFRKKAWKELKQFINVQMPLQTQIIEKLITTPSELEGDW